MYKYQYDRLTDEQRKTYDEACWAELGYEADFSWEFDDRFPLWGVLTDRNSRYDHRVSTRIDDNAAKGIDWLAGKTNTTTAAATRLALVVGLDVLMSVWEAVPGVYASAIRETDTCGDMSAARLASMVCPLVFHRLEPAKRGK